MARRSALVAALFAWLALGCAGPRPPLPQAPAKAFEIGEYRIEAGDEIEIRFPLNPEMNVRTLIRPDGKLSLQLVGEIAAEGLTPVELSQRLREAYSKELRDPEVSVVVRAMAARVFVDGAIERPGGYPWSRQITAMQAIARAGGFRDTADTDRFLVLRRGPDGKQQVFEVLLDEEEDDEGRNADLFLAPYDLVLVPSSDVADVNLWVDQYIRQNIPISPRDVMIGF
jgi:protein involved in polysaccharide export with SLBB domain